MVKGGRLKNIKIVIAVVIGIIVCGFFLIRSFRSPSHEISRTELSQLIHSKGLMDGKVTPTPYTGIYLVEAQRMVGGKAERIYIITHLDEAQIKDLFELNGIKVNVPGQGGREAWVNILSAVLICGALVFVVMRQTNVGRNKNARVKERPMVRFTDVAGIEEAKGEVREVVDFLRHPTKYQRLGGKLPKGVLLIGPPGTGKTMLAKAIAGESNAHFYSIHGSDFTEVFVGVGAKRVRQIFRQAAQHKPAIIFIDEIDCVGKSRNHDTHAEQQQTINALLAEMDGFDSSQGIVVIAATNRAEDLDAALLRPGRFDRKVNVPYPDKKGREAILHAHAQGKPIMELQTSLAQIALTTPGLSGADLANLINEAAIQCAQRNDQQITLAELEFARDKICFGQERKSMVLKGAEREMVARHEAGHTMVHLHTSLLPPLYKVSIVPRGGALGVTTLLPDEDQNIQSKQFLMEELLLLMGGRAAEMTFYKSTTNGAAGDLDTARKIARKMIHEWGMGQKLYYEPEKQDAEAEINRLLEEADRGAHALIQNYREATDRLSQALLAKETLTRQEVLDLVNIAPPSKVLAV